MKVLVCGDRNYTDVARVFEVLGAIDRINGIDTVIDGTASGADTFGHQWAVSNDVQNLRYPALWKQYGRAAGPVRNRQMLVEGKPDLVVAFHDNIAESRGTADMVRQATRAGVPVRVVSRTADDGQGTP
jgi:hypothetical protein